MGAARRAKQKHKKFQIVAIGRTYLTKLEPFSKIIADAIRLAPLAVDLSAKLDPLPSLADKLEMVVSFISQKNLISKLWRLRILL